MPVVSEDVRYKDLEEILKREKKKAWNLLQSDLSDKLGEGHSVNYLDALDSGDLSFFDLLETIGIKLVDIRQDQITKITQAERKLKEGTYGICEICGTEISEHRLEALPFAIHCIRCAKQLEGGEISRKGPTL